MKKTMILFALIVFGGSGHFAFANGMDVGFSPDGSQAYIFLTKNKEDAGALFDHLIVKGKNDGVVFQKTLQSASGDLKIDCRILKMIDQPNCTITISQGPNSFLDEKNKIISYRALDEDSIELVNGFAGRFESQSLPLVIWAQSGDFALEYNK